MMPRMNRLTYIVLLGLVGVAGCTNQNTTPEPETGPPGVDIEYHDRNESSSTEAEGSDSEVEDSTKHDESSPPKSEGKPTASPKSCKGLKKKDCEVMMGCAWSTDKICVDH